MLCDAIIVQNLFPSLEGSRVETAQRTERRPNQDGNLQLTDRVIQGVVGQESLYTIVCRMAVLGGEERGWGVLELRQNTPQPSNGPG